MKFLSLSNYKYTALLILFVATILVLMSGNSISGNASPEEMAMSQKNLERQLIAPCCYRQVLADHDSPEAERMKREITSLLQEGKTEQEIIDYYIGKYGSRILSAPPLTGFNSMSLLLPIILLIIGLGIIILLLRKWSKKTPLSIQKQQVVLNSSFDERIESELKE